MTCLEGACSALCRQCICRNIKNASYEMYVLLQYYFNTIYDCLIYGAIHSFRRTSLLYMIVSYCDCGSRFVWVPYFTQSCTPHYPVPTPQLFVFFGVSSLL